MPPRYTSFILLLLALAPAWLQSAALGATQVAFRKSGATLTVSSTNAPTQFVLEGKSGTGWKPLDVRYGGTQPAPNRSVKTKQLPPAVIFPIPQGYALDQLRVMSSPAKFPLNRLRGPKDYAGSPAPVTFGISTAMGSNVAVSASAATSAVEDKAAAVTESDIWKLIGTRLFFFNQYRGLQIFDVSDPGNPVRTGSLRLPAVGEQFYSLDDEGNNLVLLGRDSANQSSAVYLISVRKGVPELLQKLSITGDVADSRLVGSRLYLTTSEWSWANNNYSSEVSVQGFDLSNFQRPKAYDSVAFAGYAPTLQSTSTILLVATTSTQDWNTSSLQILDISQSDGQPKLIKTVAPKGTVADKFKLNVSNGIVSVVSTKWDWSESNSQRKTWVQTFRATGPDTSALAELELEEARGESLHATRFDGDKLYVVTFRNIDPLFIVDLSDPAAPKVRGHLEVPGWSSYIMPYGDRLLAAGVENGKVTVSLFDVADPAAPSLLSRVPLGEFGSWSESIYDEKAAGFFPDRGLALVPYETWGTDGWKSATAVIEVGASALTYRSSILHEFTARRAALSGNHILSISGQELVVENAQDFSKLIPVTQLSLAWQVDRVVPFGPDHIIQIEDGSANTGYFGWFAIRLAFAAESRSTMLRISKASSPDDLIEEVDMGPGKIIGTAVRDGKLYAGQFVNGKDGGKNLIRTWVFDCSNPPELPELGHVDTLLDDSAIRLNLANAAPLWPSANTLIWHIPAYAFSYYGPIAIDGPVSGPVALPSIQFSTTAQANGLVVSNTAPSPASTSTKSEKMSLPAIYPWYGESSNVTALLCPIRISQPDKPIALPLVTVQGKDGSAARNSRGQAFASGGFVFTSYQEDASGSGKDSSSNRRRAWLQVFDARDSGAIITRDRVSVPGELIGTSDVDERGALLLTTDSNSKTIQACAYDGATAYQVDAWTGSDEGATLSVSPSGRVYVARTWDRPQISSIAFDAASGRFKPGSKLSLSQPIYDLYACDDMLFVSGSALLSAIPAGPSGTLGTARTIDVSANLWVNIGRTSYVPGTGAWFPAGAYGVEFLSLKSNSR